MTDAELAAKKEQKRLRYNESQRKLYRKKQEALADQPKPPRKVRSDAGKSHKIPKTAKMKPARAVPVKQIDTRPIDDSKAIRTVWPTPPGRYEVSKDFKGPFSLVGVGRDATTGQAWRD